MDLIGQQGPSAKLHLVILDLLVLGLQLVNLGILLLKRRAKAAASTPDASATPGADGASSGAPAPASTQTLEDEERGQLRSEHEELDIELQDLNLGSSTTPAAAQRDVARDAMDEYQGDETSSREQDTLLSSTERRTDSSLFDAFNTGEIVVADLNIARLVVEQSTNYLLRRQSSMVDTGQTTASAVYTAGSGGLGYRFRIGNRTFAV